MELKEVFSFLKGTVQHPENYTCGQIDHYQKELQAAIKKLSRKKACYDDIDEKLLNIGGNIASAIHFMKTRDLIYLEGIMIRLLYGILPDIADAYPESYIKNPHYISEARKLLDQLSSYS